jgi:hypothetical protein
VESCGNDRNKFCVKAENAEIRQKTVLKKAKTAKTAKILICRQKISKKLLGSDHVLVFMPLPPNFV